MTTISTYIRIVTLTFDRFGECIGVDDNATNVKHISGVSGGASGKERKRKRRLASNLRPSSKVLRSGHRSSHCRLRRARPLRLVTLILSSLRRRSFSSPEILNLTSFPTQYQLIYVSISILYVVCVLYLYVFCFICRDCHSISFYGLINIID